MYSQLQDKNFFKHVQVAVLSGKLRCIILDIAVINLSGDCYRRNEPEKKHCILAMDDTLTVQAGTFLVTQFVERRVCYCLEYLQCTEIISNLISTFLYMVYHL
jgi:hypothetical protein